MGSSSAVPWASTHPWRTSTRLKFFAARKALLYGRNTIAGAVNITTKPPSNDLGFNVDLNLGNYDRRDAEVGLSGPLVPGVLLGKISAFVQRNDGYVRNIADGRDLLNENRQGGRAALYFTPTESLEIRFRATSCTRTTAPLSACRWSP